MIAVSQLIQQESEKNTLYPSYSLHMRQTVKVPLKKKNATIHINFQHAAKIWVANQSG